jgi:hypothetical protein
MEHYPVFSDFSPMEQSQYVQMEHSWSSPGSDFDFKDSCHPYVRAVSMKFPLRDHEVVDLQRMDQSLQRLDALPNASELTYMGQYNVYHPPHSFRSDSIQSDESPILAHFHRSSSPSSSCSSNSGSWNVCRNDNIFQFVEPLPTQMDINCMQGQPWASSGDMMSFQIPSPPLSGGGNTPCIALSQVQQFPEETRLGAGLEHDDSQDAHGDFEDWGELPHIVVDAEAPPLLEESVDSIVDQTYIGQGDDEDDANDSEFKPTTRTSKRSTKRRSSNASAKSRLTGSSGGTKRNSKGKTAASKFAGGTARPFPCPLTIYGCTSTFANKNEWKRHASTQHVKLGYYRCSLCPADPSPNDFNRKDLFTQHLRRLHRPTLPDFVGARYATFREKDTREHTDAEILQLQNSCWRVLRPAPPKSECLFCPRVFAGEGSWDERMEHVAGHMERSRRAGSKAMDSGSWRPDVDLRTWLAEEGLIEMDSRNQWQIGSGVPNRR